jgi:hypothetical protein
MRRLGRKCGWVVRWPARYRDGVVGVRWKRTIALLMAAFWSGPWPRVEAIRPSGANRSAVG